MKRLPCIAAIAAWLLPALLLAGCAPRSGPPPIPVGDRCASCGMTIRDLHFACEREVGGKYRAYDAIECLVKDARKEPGGAVYLPDYDAGTLAAADSMWVVKGTFPTPMGGGLAAFRDRAAADAIAGQTGGRVGRFAELLTGSAVEADSTGADSTAAEVAP